MPLIYEQSTALVVWMVHLFSVILAVFSYSCVETEMFMQPAYGS